MKTIATATVTWKRAVLTGEFSKNDLLDIVKQMERLTPAPPSVKELWKIVWENYREGKSFDKVVFESEEQKEIFRKALMRTMYVDKLDMKAREVRCK